MCNKLKATQGETKIFEFTFYDVNGVILPLQGFQSAAMQIRNNGVLTAAGACVINSFNNTLQVNVTVPAQAKAGLHEYDIDLINTLGEITTFPDNGPGTIRIYKQITI